MVPSGVKEIHRSERGGKKGTSIVLYLQGTAWIGALR